MPNTRVLHLAGLGGGGVETVVQTLSAALADDFAFGLLTPAGSLYTDQPFPRESAPADRLGHLRRFWRLARAFRRFRPHIVHAHDPCAMVWAHLTARTCIPAPDICVHFHGTLLGGSRTAVGRTMSRRFASSSARVLACSGATANAAVMAYDLCPDAISVIYNPVDTSFVKRAEPDLSFRSQLGLSRDTPLVLFVGRLGIQTKGLDVLSEALSLIPTDVQLGLAIVGPGDEDAVKKLFSRSQHAVRVMGARPHEDIASLMKAADLLVQPSRHEGLPLTVIEAMAAGLPVIASRVGGIPEAVDDGVTGILVDPEAPQQLARALQATLTDRELRERFGEAGQRRADQLFDIEVIARQMADLYRGALRD